MKLLLLGSAFGERCLHLYALSVLVRWKLERA